MRGLNSCSPQALENRLSSGGVGQSLCGMWDLPGPGVKSVSPALAEPLPTTKPPEMPCKTLESSLLTCLSTL